MKSTDYSRASTHGESQASQPTVTVLRQAQRVVKRKRSPLIILRLLRDEPQGFTALKKGIDGISSKVLSTNLSALEEMDIIEREIIREKPFRVQYSLTDQGKELEPLIVEMLRWGAGETANGDCSPSLVDTLPWQEHPESEERMNVEY
jgi:DNA-binding HxlR family transcriptional regulator